MQNASFESGFEIRISNARILHPATCYYCIEETNKKIAPHSVLFSYHLGARLILFDATAAASKH